MNDKHYSITIADAINTFLEEDDWRFSFDEKLGIFKFPLNLKGKMKKINYIIDVERNEYIVYTISPLGADEDDETIMANMAEFICRANYGLRMGNFELDFNDGEIRFKVHVPCNEIIPTTEMIQKSIYCPAKMFERYSSGILSVLFNHTSGKEAVEQCEAKNRTQLWDILERMLESGNENSDAEETSSESEGIESMIARLAARFGSDAEETSSTENTENSDEEPEIHTDLFGKKGGETDE